MFNINNEFWTLEFVPFNDRHLRRPNGSYTIGSCDDDLKRIFLSENLSGAMLKKVLCHELTHAAMFSYDVNLTVAQEEMLADIIATYGEEIISITNTLFYKKKWRY